MSTEPHAIIKAPLVLFPAPQLGILYLPVAAEIGGGLAEAYRLAHAAPLELADPVAVFTVGDGTVELAVSAPTSPPLAVRLGWDLTSHRAVLQGLGLLPESGISLFVALLPDREAIRSLATKMGTGDRTAMGEAGGIWAECDPSPLAGL